MADERKIKEGIISERKFVELFATQKQKEKYRANGDMFTSSNKKTVLKQAMRECEVEDIGKREYKISKVYQYPVPPNFDSMNKGLNKYLIPLILNNLIYAVRIYEIDNITFSTTRWFEEIDLINRNYAAMKSNIDYSCKKISVDKSVLTEYFTNTDDKLLYFFKKSLEHLKASNLFNYQEINWVCVMEMESESEATETQKIKMKRIHRRATPEEMSFIRKCDQAACRTVGIANDDPDAYKEKYYGSKSHSYLKTYKDLLRKRNILFVYKAYEIYHTDRDIQKCIEVLKAFELQDKNELTSELVSAFQKNLIMNAEKRIEDKPYKYGIHNERQAEKFISDYEKVASLTLGNIENDKILHGIPKTIDEADATFINDFIDGRLNITLNGEKLNIGVGTTTKAV